MGIFSKNKENVKSAPVMASAPNEPETQGEINHVKELSAGNDVVQQEPSNEVVQEEVQQTAQSEQEIAYREVPVSLSQNQINNLVIDNNRMLKWLTEFISNVK